jgi:hypothetical protein
MLDHEDRHAFGAHFTAPVDIMKIVGPTVVEPCGVHRRLAVLGQRQYNSRQK